MLDDPAIVVDTKDVDARPFAVRTARPLLTAMQHDELAFGDDALEVHALAGVLARHAFEVGDEGLLAIGDGRVVLNVARAGVALDGVPRPALVEHQVVESHDVGLVAFEICRHVVLRRMVGPRLPAARDLHTLMS